MNLEKIKMQKLIFKYDGNYDLTFIDENEKLHKESDAYCSACVDLYCLVQSCFEPPIDSIFTCSCGEPACAGIHYFSSWLTDKEVFWKVNDDYLRFDRTQYVEEILSKINLMVDIEPKYDESDYFRSPLDNESILKLKNALDNYSELIKKDFPRHKIILCPNENYIYIEENGKKIGLNKKDCLKFKGKDFLGQDFCMESLEEDLKKWALEIKQNPSINWKRWNLEGIEYAKGFREILPAFFDVWYRFQGEEKEDLQITYDME